MINTTDNTDAATILPLGASAICGEMGVCGDKSISHRAVMLGSIAEGTTEINNILLGADNKSTIEAFGSMGVEIRQEPITGSPTTRLGVKGVGLRGLKAPQGVIDCKNSGTTARLLMGLLSAQNFDSELTGDDSLRRRPMKRVIEPLGMMGADIRGSDKGRFLPVKIHGRELESITYSTPIASAQLKSAILLAALYARGTTVVEEPAKSRDHTERMLKHFGVSVGIDDNRVSLAGGQRLKAAKIDVPGDISSAAFFIVGAMITEGSKLLIKDVGVNPTRCGIIDILRKMGGSIEITNLREGTEPVADILVKGSRLKATTINGTELLPAIDEFPAICAAAAYADGVTTITGATELRVKESDRIATMAEGLSRVGIEVKESADGMAITGGRPQGAVVKSHGDHRVAMAMAACALGAKEPITIEGAGCVEVSFPGFFERLDEIRVR